MENIIKITIDEDNQYLFNSDNIVSINLTECRLFEGLDSCKIEITTLKNGYVIKLNESLILQKFKIKYSIPDLNGKLSINGWDMTQRYKFCESICNDQRVDEWVCDCGNSAIRSIYESFRGCNNIELDEDWCVTVYEKLED